jgi:hypothetical protein
VSDSDSRVNPEEQAVNQKTLEALLEKYAREAPNPSEPARNAQRLCAPCGHVVNQIPLKYCTSVSLAGESYCAAHSRKTVKATKSRLALALPKIAHWRSREFA